MLSKLNKIAISCVAVFACVFSAAGQTRKPEKLPETVVLDDFFNHETKQDEDGKTIVWHYKWDETDNGGYSIWRDVFKSLGARTEMLSTAPTSDNLKNADIYIIVDPDTDKESPKPNYVQPEHIKAITDWVKKGGVLVLLGNDVGNAEFQHFNQLAKEFGIHFNEDSLNRVQGNNYAQGRVTVDAGNEVLPNARTLFLKEISSINVQPPAKALITANGHVLMATAQYGKGTVFAVGDPWIYNEYTDGKKLPAEYENLKAAQDLSRWLMMKAGRR